MILIEIFSILIIHYIADFIIQTEYQELNKSSSIKALTSHTATYSLAWSLLFLFLGWPEVIWFVLITFVFHTITDYITSRIVKRYFENEKNRKGFMVIGFDQLLHYVQLFLTYIILTA